MDRYFYVCFCVLAFILGACFGSFANVLIYRLPSGESIVKGASHCTVCKHKLAPKDNIPILSYLFLRGKCRYCGEKISPRYFFVELVTCLTFTAFALASKTFGYVYAAACMPLAFCAITIAVIDFNTGYIPDSLNLTIAVLGVIACVYSAVLGGYISWLYRLIGLGACALLFGGIYFISKLILKRDGLGFGDVKFMCACGLFLGAKSALFATLIATVSASIILLIVHARKKNADKNTEYPFAPFLAAGVIISAFFGEMVWAAYLSLF